MSKFNTTNVRPATHSPVTSERIPSGVTHEGGDGYARDTKSELFLLAISNMVGEDSFYERGGQRDDRYTQLVHQATASDPEWTARLLGWLRSTANMRSASLVGAAEFVAARLADGVSGMSRQVVDSVLQRADEPGEFLAYWTAKHGRAIPKPVKRGLADAVLRLYNERSFLKWDSSSRGFRFGDVLNLVHPAAKAGWQGHLFEFALSERKNRGATPDPDALPMLAANWVLRDLVSDDPAHLLDVNKLNRAGMTWEAALSLAGSRIDKAQLWTALLPSMGYMALLRNLRNFDQTGVSDEVAATVAARLADPAEVAKSRQLPMRFLSAYKAAPSLRWAWALEQALTLSLANVPELPGRTLVLVDRSGSMFYDNLSRNSDLTRAEAAAVFGTAVALRAADADLVQFGTDALQVPLRKGESVLPVVKDRFDNLGGTNTVGALRQFYRGHDRVVIVTDEQHNSYYGGSPSDAVPATVPLYTWNLAGYQRGHGPSGSANRHTFGGLTDQAFRMIPLLEAGQNADWPF